MTAQTSMLYATRIAKEDCLSPGLIADSASYDAWFKAKVHEAMNDDSPTIPHEHVMDSIQALIDRKRNAVR